MKDFGGETPNFEEGVMKKFFVLTVLALLVAAAAFERVLAAPPDPADSVILESKVVDTVSGASGSGVVKMRVWITNKDSLTIVTLALKETTLSNGAYLILSHPRSFAGVVVPQTTTLQGSKIFFGGKYNSTSPDSFLVSGIFDPLDPTSIEPPNAARKALWDIKFDTASATANGIVEFDSAKVNQNTGFTTTFPLDIPVNFVKSQITVLRTDVREVKGAAIPTIYSLGQNYPNPFNANTQIQFALPKAGKTTLEVFNILGQKVNTLLDEYLTAGFKIVNWDGRDQSGSTVASGVYFYRLRSENFLQTKKMLMIK